MSCLFLCCFIRAKSKNKLLLRKKNYYEYFWKKGLGNYYYHQTPLPSQISSQPSSWLRKNLDLVITIDRTMIWTSGFRNNHHPKQGPEGTRKSLAHLHWALKMLMLIKCEVQILCYLMLETMQPRRQTKLDTVLSTDPLLFIVHYNNIPSSISDVNNAYVLTKLIFSWDRIYHNSQLNRKRWWKIQKLSSFSSDTYLLR